MEKISHYTDSQRYSLSDLGRLIFMEGTIRIHPSVMPRRLIEDPEYTEEFRRLFIFERNKFFRDHANKMEFCFERIR